MQFFYSATNGSDTGSVVAAVVGNEATANLSDLLPATTYTVYGVVTATNGSTPQSSSTTFTTEGARTDHAAWYELPAKDNAGSNMLLRTFYDTARNYTMYYDTSTYTAYWVAYPLAAGDLGSGRPNDPWAATPGIPTSQQINVWAGSYGVNVGSTSNIYARGHQIPNADRNKDPYGTMCAQTFYATNSTPQIQNGFNSGIWSTLEGDVRTLAQQQTDTVYVVTGAILRTVTGNETITYIKPAKDTKNCPVPNYYYKVLLKVKREASGKISSASTVGVWLPHRVYSGESYQSYTKSVAEIEALTGYNFFANLPADIQAAAEQNSNWSIRIVLNGRKNLRYDKTTRIIPFDACRFVLSIHPNGSFFRKNSYLYESENRRIRKPTLEADATKRREYSVASEGGKPQISDRRGP